MRDHLLGLYLHLPFCARICHYCDFVKSALYNDEQKRAYLKALDELLEQWIRAWPTIPSAPEKLTSVFWGGGTPSLVTHELAPIMERIRPHLLPDAEISLEANPEHINPQSVKVWADLGINRLSLGVQSFGARGLKVMTREHSPEQAIRAVLDVREQIPNVNVDLIYGWPGQTEDEWQMDLQTVLELRPAHISLYNMTYEGRTPFARRLERGLIQAEEDEALEKIYQSASAALKDAGYIHEEVSNWALPGFFARHNGLYWNGGSYIGLGAGAHSYLETLGPWGCRWKQDANWRHFQGLPDGYAGTTADELIARRDMSREAERDADAWILEVVSSSLRTKKGTNLDAICMRTGYTFVPQPAVRQALDLGLMHLSQDGILTLSEAEWFRETRWSLECALSFVKGK